MLLLLRRERLGEFDAHADNEVTALVRFLAFRHPKTGEPFCKVGSCRAAATNRNLFSVNRLNGSVPAGQSFFQVEFDDMLYIIAFAGK